MKVTLSPTLAALALNPQEKQALLRTRAIISIGGLTAFELTGYDDSGPKPKSAVQIAVSQSIDDILHRSHETHEKKSADSRARLAARLKRMPKK
jgi:hypothetical protein